MVWTGIICTGIYRLCQSMPMPFCPFLSLSVPVCPCISLSVPVCPCLFLSLPVCPFLSMFVNAFLYFSSTCVSPPPNEYEILHQYEYSYFDFACKSHCSNACTPNLNFFVLIQFWSCFFKNSFIWSKLLSLVCFKICFFSANECNKWLSFFIPLINIYVWCSFYSPKMPWKFTWCWKDNLMGFELLSIHNG